MVVTYLSNHAAVLICELCYAKKVPERLRSSLTSFAEFCSFLEDACSSSDSGMFAALDDESEVQNVAAYVHNVHQFVSCLSHQVVNAPRWTIIDKWFEDYNNQLNAMLTHNYTLLQSVIGMYTVRTYNHMQNTTLRSFRALVLLTQCYDKLLRRIYEATNGIPANRMKDVLFSSLPEPNVQCAELSRKCIGHVFPASLVATLKVIFGGPLTVNVRNLLWHGFLSVSDFLSLADTQQSIPTDMLETLVRFLVSVLIYVAVEASHVILPVPSHTVRSLAKADAVSFTNPVVDQLSPLHHESCMVSFLQTISSNEHLQCDFLISSDSLSITSVDPQLNSLLNNQIDVHLVCSLGVIALERILRLQYCAVTGEWWRAKSTDNEHLFTTMDFLLEEKAVLVILKNSAAPQNFPENVKDADNGFTEALLDFFKRFDGPRFRDHLSHGEIDANSLRKSHAFAVLNLLRYAYFRFGYDSKPLADELGCSCIANAFVQYVPVYSPIARILTVMERIQECVRELCQRPVIAELLRCVTTDATKTKLTVGDLICVSNCQSFESSKANANLHHDAVNFSFARAAELHCSFHSLKQLEKFLQNCSALLDTKFSDWEERRRRSNLDALVPKIQWRQHHRLNYKRLVQQFLPAILPHISSVLTAFVHVIQRMKADYAAACTTTAEEKLEANRAKNVLRNNRSRLDDAQKFIHEASRVFDNLLALSSNNNNQWLKAEEIFLNFNISYVAVWYDGNETK